MALICNFDMCWLPNEFKGDLPLKAVKPLKVKPNIVEMRATKAQAKLDEWERKAKRAKTFIKKYQRKVRYYQRKMAASPPKPKPG